MQERITLWTESCSNKKILIKQNKKENTEGRQRRSSRTRKKTNCIFFPCRSIDRKYRCHDVSSNGLSVAELPAKPAMATCQNWTKLFSIGGTRQKVSTQFHSSLGLLSKSTQQIKCLMLNFTFKVTQIAPLDQKCSLN